MYKEIEGYDGRYQVNELGDVREWSREKSTWVDRAPSMVEGEYPIHHLKTPEGKRRTVRLHRIVAQTHIPNLNGKPWVLHKDGDKNNCRADNLYWGTPKENTADSIRHKTHRNTRKTHCVRGHPLNGGNLKLESGGKRQCVACLKLKAKKNLKGTRKPATHCIHGHALSGENLILALEGGRERRRCRECKRQSQLRYKERIRTKRKGG